ncbi:hypothetical protein B9Z19DRAFT_1136788 [Tuber borchii]|uniref:Uncharacterized protein n=1 Tax=Tuber borchii TaxID=42251 RepID=A0A2T6ZB78_TUBBO|nr:hypothetical protein B9Z19DRAFT_1136788 [Tuber borchii]
MGNTYTNPQPEGVKHVLQPTAPFPEINAIRPSGQRTVGKLYLHSVFRELAYRAMMEKRSSQFTMASARPSVDSALRKRGFPSPGEAPVDGLGLEELDTDGENEMADGMDEGHKVWRDMKARKYGIVGSGLDGWVAGLETRVW